MTAKRLIVAFAVVALVGSAVASPVAAAATTSDGMVASSDDAAAGPPADLPGPVPAFVEQLLGAIRSFVGSVPAGIVG